MVELSPEFLAKCRTVFQGAHPTLEEVRQKLDGLESATRRRDAQSAFKAIENQFKVNLAATPATFPVLRRIFSSRNAAQLDLSPKRYANIRSEVFRSVREFGTPSPNLTRGPELSPEWKALLAMAKDRSYRASLRRLGQFCSAMDISTLEVCRAALLGFYEALDGEGGVKDPRVILRHVTAYWNYYERRIPEWPRLRLKTPFAANRYLLSLADLSPSLRNEIALWQQRRAGGDLLSLDKVAHKSRPETIQYQTNHILRFLGLAVGNGLAQLSELKHLSDIVEPELVQAVVTILLKQRGRSVGYAHSFTYVLLGIARHETNLPAQKILQLATFSANLRHAIKRGMTKKNRGLLRQFDNPENVQALFAYSTKERQRGAKHENPYRQAKCYERALIADLFIHGALRIKNIVMLRTYQNMRKHGSAYILTFTADEMKTKRSHEIQLPDWLTQHIDEYRALYRPQLIGHRGPYLFPGEMAEGHRHHSAIREEFKDHIYRELGLKVHPHFMRHLTSKLILDEDPGQLKTVSDRLGHSTTETAQTTYLETDSLSASRRANAFLSTLSRKDKRWEE
jgi:integrase